MIAKRAVFDKKNVGQPKQNCAEVLKPLMVTYMNRKNLGQQTKFTSK